MGRCCNNVGPTDMSSLLLNVVASKTKPKIYKCCSNNKKDDGCSCRGNAGPLRQSTINRDKQILQIIKCCK
jgi:hypothetical protein